MMVFRSPIKTIFALLTVFSLLVSSSEAQNETCASETAVVQSNAGVVSATEAAINGTLTLESALDCSSGSSTVSCSFDFATVSSNVESACTAAGGQYVDYTFALTCDITAPNGTTFEATYDFANTPTCIGDSCDPSEYVDSFTTEFAAMLDNFTAIDNCAVAVTSPAPTIRGAKTFLVITGALLASTFLF